MYFNKGNFFENPGIMATTLIDWQNPQQLNIKNYPLSFSYISLPKCCITFEVFVEQDIHLQKLCLSLSHYETAYTHVVCISR